MKLLSVFVLVATGCTISRQSTPREPIPMEYPKGWEEITSPPVAKAPPVAPSPEPRHRTTPPEFSRCAPQREKLAELRSALAAETHRREEWMHEHCKLESVPALGAAHWVCNGKHLAGAQDNIQTPEERRIDNEILGKQSWISRCCEGVTHPGDIQYEVCRDI